MANTDVTAAQVAAAQKALDDAQAAHAAATTAAAGPRAASTVLMDILTFITSKLGNHPLLEALLKELEAAGASVVAKVEQEL
jgi:chromate transport protein ChrA